MSAIKGLLLGTAAGLVAVAGAQAADMPVKAKPVQFVKICTLYGDGFYYIPGTDTCLKLGGYVRVQTETHAGGGINDGTISQITQARYNRVDTNDVDYRIRAALSLDVRDQTQYGTLRSYFRIGVQQTTPADPIGGAVFWDRAFIQWAGFTVGKAQSFFDTGSYEHFFSYQNVRTGSNTIDTGWNVWAYTAELGNGWSATLSLEDPNTNKRAVCESTVAGPVGGTSANCFNYGSITADNAFGLQTTSNNGMRMPDVIANVRLEQAWGYWSLSGALHDVAGAYYGAPNNVNNGHPTDRKGWAVGTGVQLNLPGGDVFGVNGQYSVGAAGYGSAGGQWAILNPGTSAGVGWQVDGVFTNGGEVELTKVWNVIAWYQHIWNPKWRTSFYGGYVSTEYNDAAKLVLNPVAVCGGTGPGVVGITLQPGNSCSPDFSYWQAGTRTQWNPHPLLDIGLEVYYTRLNTAYKGPATVSPGGPQQPVGLLDDQNVWSAIFRWQRNFYP